MFATFKKLFCKDIDNGLATSIPEAGRATDRTSWAASTSAPTTVTFSPESTAQTTYVSGAEKSPDSVSLPIKTMLASLPSALASVVQSQGNGFVTLSAKRILQELPKGAVKVPFAELRRAAPPGTFFENSRFDETLIELPLGDILPRLHPSLLSRRTDQKQILLPADIKDVFGPRGEGISISSPSAPALKPLPQRPTAPDPVPARQLFSSAPATSPVIPQLRVLPSASNAIADGTHLEIPLRELAEKWSETIHKEIGLLNLKNAVIAFPLEKIEPLLKTGKIIFSWNQICQWAQPPAEALSDDEKLILELPLHIVAPLFLAQHRPTQEQKKISFDEMPDLFVHRRVGVAVAPTVVPPIANVEPLAEPVETPPVAAPSAQKNPLGELLGRPTKHEWSPNEIVKSLAAWPGLAGAFLAMQDGLLVAAELPSNFKAETVAAFLPQMFGRMNQYTKELQIGGLSGLTFEVENISWRIQKTGAVYLVVIGKAGEDLPREKLNLIAALISKQIQ